jgi:intron-binding protein aquarius
VPHFYQNLGEAEYLVSVFQYMRLLGYPAKQISILTTYNGQKALLRDVIEQRCAHHPAFGRPHKVPRRARSRPPGCKLPQTASR